MGAHCPECVRELRDEQRARSRQTRMAHGGPRTELGRRVRQWLAQPAPVTIAIVAVTALVGALQILPGNVSAHLMHFLPYSLIEPWRFLTYALVHASLLHFAFNMMILWMVGPAIEQRIGRLPYLAVYLVSAAGAAVAVAWLTPASAVVGASGAIYALFGMAIGMQRMLGRVQPALLLMVGISLALTFVSGGVSWPAHIGGLAIGLALGFGIGTVQGRMRDRGTKRAAWLVIVGVALLLAALLAARVASLP